MAATGTCFSPVTFLLASSSSTSSPKLNLRPHTQRRLAAVASDHVQAETPRININTTPFPANYNLRNLDKRRQEKEEEEEDEAYKDDKENGTTENNNNSNNPYALALKGVVEAEGKRGLKDYLEESKELLGRRADGGPPRWFSPLECGARSDNSPLLLFFPGIIGVGLGLSTQYHALGKLFDIWCLHIPPNDRTSFRGLIQIVERTVRSEYKRTPNKPIYLAAESLGACIALAVAARNPDIDLILVLANPATSFDRLPLQPLLKPLLEAIPYQLLSGLTNLPSLITDDLLRMTIKDVVKRLVPQLANQGLSENVAELSSYLSVLGNVFSKDTLLWKLEILKSASAYANSRLHSIKAQTLVLCSGKDQLLPSEEEGQRLRHVMLNCIVRLFEDSGHQIFLEDDINLATIIKGSSFYRRGRQHHYVTDYVPPTPSEFKKIYESHRLLLQGLSSVMLSTFEDGKIVKGLAGIPSEGPVLMVGYHMFMGLDVIPIIPQFLVERNIIVRGMAHPLVFEREKEDGILPPLSYFDMHRVMGAVPVTGSNFYKLMTTKSHALLYPGGVREAFHRKGEEYILHWPEQAEFIRMAARFGAKIVPFGAVGEDDIMEMVLDYDDQMKIPIMRDYIKSITDEAINVRPEGTGEVANQDLYFPVVLPKIPGRFYYCFGKPIETEGRKQELRDKEKAHELYLQIQSEVQKCIAFLKEKRESDPYRSLLARIAYQATHGPNSEVPTFDL